MRVSPLSGLPTDIVRLKAHRHCYFAASGLRQVRKRRGAAGLPPAPAICPRVLARPGENCRASSGSSDPAPAQAAPAVDPAPAPVLPVSASVLSLGHSAPRPLCGGDGIPRDPPADGARTRGGGRRRPGGRAQRERPRFRCHAAAVVESESQRGTRSDSGEVLLFSLHNNRIVASLGLEKLAHVALGVVVDTGAGPSVVYQSALVPGWLHQVVTSKEEEQARLRHANEARLRTSGTVALWLQAQARMFPGTVLVFDDLSVPVIRGCTFIRRYHGYLMIEYTHEYLDVGTHTRKPKACGRFHPSSGSKTRKYSCGSQERVSQV